VPGTIARRHTDSNVGLMRLQNRLAGKRLVQPFQLVPETYETDRIQDRAARPNARCRLTAMHGYVKPVPVPLVLRFWKLSTVNPELKRR
jgi:hypothetical protein